MSEKVDRVVLATSQDHGVKAMATKQTKGSKERLTSKLGGAKTARQPSRPSRKSATRREQYLEVFVPQPAFFGADDFFPQVDGYGTPIVARVSSFAGG